MQRWHVLRGPWFDCSLWKLPSRLVLSRRRPQRVLYPLPFGYISSRGRAAIVRAMHARQFLRRAGSHCCRRSVPAWELLSQRRQFIGVHQLRCGHVLCRRRPRRCVWPLSGGLVLRFKRDGRYLHTVPPRPLSGPYGPVLLHTVQPRLVPKRIRAALLSPLLSRNVLRSVGSDCSYRIVPSRLVFCCGSNCGYMHRVCPGLLSTGNGAASVHALQSRAVLLRFGADCCDGQLPSRILFGFRCNCCCLHALSRRHDESKHWASALHPMQPRRLLRIDRSCCCQRPVPNGHVLPRRSIVCNVHPVRPWQVLRIVGAWIRVWHVPSWFVFYWRRCICCLRRLPRGHAAKCHRTVGMCAVLSRHVLRVCGTQQSNRPLQRRIVLFRRRHSIFLHQLQHRHI
jgi:hypothetical protein